MSTWVLDIDPTFATTPDETGMTWYWNTLSVINPQLHHAMGRGNPVHTQLSLQFNYFELLLITYVFLLECYPITPGLCSNVQAAWSPIDLHMRGILQCFKSWNNIFGFNVESFNFSCRMIHLSISTENGIFRHSLHGFSYIGLSYGFDSASCKHKGYLKLVWILFDYVDCCPDCGYVYI